MVADGEAGGEQPEYQEGLRGGLVLHIVLDRVRQEELKLEEDLRPATAEARQGQAAGGLYYL